MNFKDSSLAERLHPLTRGRAWVTGLVAGGVGVLSMVGCQTIVEEPVARPVPNSPPVIEFTHVTPRSTAVYVAGNCASVKFSLNRVRDLDLDQTLTERWYRDFVDPALSSADGGQLQPQDGYLEVALTRFPNDPAEATDPPDVYSIPVNVLDAWSHEVPLTLHTVTVFVSDGPFAGSPTVSPYTPSADRAVVQYEWTVFNDAPCGVQ